MKRVLLFLVTNLAVLITLGIVANILCVFLGPSVAEVIGDQWADLAIWAFVYGLIGAFISLLLSKPIAKIACRAQTIDGSEGEAERWLVSTDIMGQMTREELRAVLGHEMSHVANGDMVTLTLVQGVLNAFVIFFSRAIATVLANAGNGEGNRRRSNGGIYFLTVMVLDIVLGILASLVVFAFSRRREYAADAGSARLLGSPSPMITALRRLGNLQPGVLPDSLKAMGIAEGDGKTSIWATHPSLADRIAALQNLGISALA